MSPNVSPSASTKFSPFQGWSTTRNINIIVSVVNVVPEISREVMEMVIIPVMVVTVGPICVHTSVPVIVVVSIERGPTIIMESATL